MAIVNIGPNAFAEVDYVLLAEDGEVLDDSSAEGGAPIRYVHGYGMLVPGLEARLVGLGEGDDREIVVPADEAYGLHDEELVYALERSAAPDAQEGDELVIEDEGGEQSVVHVVETGEDEILVDGNHPLAGLTLRYRVHVQSVRPATQEEIAQAAAAFEEERDAAEPAGELVPLFSLKRPDKPDPPS